MSIETALKENLINLGLTNNETDVYLALLELKIASSGPIIKKTQLHRNVVYTSLSHLVKKRLVSEKSVRGIKTFSIVEPDSFTSDFEQKANLAKEVEKDILAKIPQKNQEITIHQGNEEYLQLLTGLLRSMPEGSTKYVIGTGGEDFMRETMRPIWKKYHKVARNKRINIKMISYESQRSSIEEDVHNESMYEIKYLPDMIENPAGVHVYPEADTILNIIYSDSKNPVTAIKIKNEALVKGYLNLFNNLWNNKK